MAGERRFGAGGRDLRVGDHRASPSGGQTGATNSPIPIHLRQHEISARLALTCFGADSTIRTPRSGFDRTRNAAAREPILSVLVRRITRQCQIDSTDAFVLGRLDRRHRIACAGDLAVAGRRPGLLSGGGRSRHGRLRSETATSAWPRRRPWSATCNRRANGRRFLRPIRSTAGWPSTWPAIMARRFPPEITNPRIDFHERSGARWPAPIAAHDHETVHVDRLRSVSERAERRGPARCAACGPGCCRCRWPKCCGRSPRPAAISGCWSNGNSVGGDPVALVHLSRRADDESELRARSDRAARRRDLRRRPHAPLLSGRIGPPRAADTNHGDAGLLPELGPPAVGTTTATRPAAPRPMTKRPATARPAISPTRRVRGRRSAGWTGSSRIGDKRESPAVRLAGPGGRGSELPAAQPAAGKPHGDFLRLALRAIACFADRAGKCRHPTRSTCPGRRKSGPRTSDIRRDDRAGGRPRSARCRRGPSKGPGPQARRRFKHEIPVRRPRAVRRHYVPEHDESPLAGCRRDSARSWLPLARLIVAGLHFSAEMVNPPTVSDFQSRSDEPPGDSSPVLARRLVFRTRRLLLLAGEVGSGHCQPCPRTLWLTLVDWRAPEYSCLGPSNLIRKARRTGKSGRGEQTLACPSSGTNFPTPTVSRHQHRRGRSPAGSRLLAFRAA